MTASDIGGMVGDGALAGVRFRLISGPRGVRVIVAGRELRGRDAARIIRQLVTDATPRDAVGARKVSP